MFHSGSRQLSNGRISDDRILLGWMIILIVLRLWLVEVYELMATWTPHDDYLFIRLAKHLLSGEWLGPYNHFTLIKGPGYPLFIAASHLAGIPLLLSQQLLYSFACVLAISALRPFCGNRYLLMACFALLLLNPFLYNYPVPGRAFREGFSISLVLIVFATLLGSITRLCHSGKRSLKWSTGFGLAFTLLWHTREEGLWLLPSVALAALMIILVDRTDSRITLYRRILVLLIPLALFCTASFSLALLNYRNYGEFIINELKSKEFISAYGGLMNIIPDHFKRFTPVSDDVLHKAYAASPAFRELEPFFTADAQKSHRVPPFFIWSLRGAVRDAGYASNPTEALRYYGRIGDELAQACRDGRLDCLDRSPSLQPPWHSSYNKKALPVFFEIFKQAVGFNHYRAELEKFEMWQSNGKAELIKDYHYVTLEKILPSDRKIVSEYPEYYQHLRIEKVRLLKDIGDSYKFLAPLLFSLALVIHLRLLFQSLRMRHFSVEVIFGLVLIGGLISLVAILSFVNITLWPIRRPLYSAYPIILLYICCMLGSLWQGIRQEKHPL